MMSSTSRVKYIQASPVARFRYSEHRRRQSRKSVNGFGHSTQKIMVLVDFSTVAQQAKTYEEYEQGMRETDEADLCYMGIGIYAEKRIINKATGNLSLIR
ncbi:DUF2000 family protein [Phocaeicola dorei]|uniref:DUF2000 family protein n=1 Tax=Phocaeicola dorei TaxID=357276 RepID=UPI00293941B7|nr:DUF2000 family protein [Phocaeicola dorei]